MKPNGTVHLSDIPELAREWDFEKNISDLTPDKITVGSNRIVWWRCAKGHSWKDAVVKRTHGKPCPYCTNRRVLIGYNDLATLYPKLANEWDYSNNVGVDIIQLCPDAQRKFRGNVRLAGTFGWPLSKVEQEKEQDVRFVQRK